VTSDLRRVCYVSGTRADFGLLRSTLRAIRLDERFDLSIVTTGTHLADAYGATAREIEAEGLRVAARVPVDLGSADGASMARNIGHMLIGFVDAFRAERPDAVLLLGDRGEMLAGAIAAAHLGIAIVHIHGGERSGTVDESVRHAISKLAHYHLVATEASRDRLVRMGERGKNIHVVGAPGLDGLRESANKGRAELCASIGLDPGKPLGLMVFHPVLQEASSAGEQVQAVLNGMEAAGLQTLALMPNSDAGSDEVRRVLLAQAKQRVAGFVVQTHLPRDEFVSWMASSDVMVGNSSSGVIEAASFGTPVVNVGSRQNMRERNANVWDVPPDSTSVSSAICRALRVGRLDGSNVYGDGRSGERIFSFLLSMNLSASLLAKCNDY
jgi:GDP/UDP-N,N'-diacetylbacillosamine 2-epimerase (hydrolysing)